jgi:hypothetical protein
VSGEFRFTDEPYSEADALPGAPHREHGATPTSGAHEVSRRRRNFTYLAALGTLVVAVGLTGVHERRTSTPALRPSVASPSKPAARSATAESAGSDDPLRDLKVQAYLAGPLTGEVRAPRGGCLTARTGHPPRAAIDAAIRRVLPRVVEVDSSAIVDGFAGLCSIELRARNRSGTTALITVTVPSGAGKARPTTLSTTADAIGGVTSTLVRAVTATGWTIQVGATGPAACQPSLRELATLARDPVLTW